VVERESAIVSVCKEGASYAADRFRTEFDIETKSSAIDPVTEIDRETQERVLSAIEGRFPDDTIVAEEGAEAEALPESGYAWIVDPIDGTHNYSREISEWVTSVAVLRDLEPIAAINSAPRLEETYIATAGDFTRNGTSQSVSATSAPESFLVASTLRLSTSESTRISALAENVIAEFGEFRRIGSAQLTLSLLAAGSLDAVIGFAEAPHPWDTIAGVFQIRQAGGTVTDINGNRWKPGHPGIVASNDRIHDDIVELARRSMG
jgi:myo-inositol-1(or 4)-monophosphatase